MVKPQQAAKPHTLPHWRTGKSTWTVEVRKLVGWGKDSLIKKEKAACASKEKWKIHSPLPINRLHHVLTVTWEDKYRNSKHFPLLFLTLPSFYCWAQHHMVRDISLVILGQMSQLGPLPTSCPSPAYSLVRQCEKQKRPGCGSALFCLQIPKEHHTNCYGEIYLYPPKEQCSTARRIYVLVCCKCKCQETHIWAGQVQEEATRGFVWQKLLDNRRELQWKITYAFPFLPCCGDTLLSTAGHWTGESNQSLVWHRVFTIFSRPAHNIYKQIAVLYIDIK